LLSPTVIAEGEVNVMVCDALLKVKVTFALVAELYVESSAFVAAIKHVPEVVAVIVAVEDESLNVHVLAVPPDTIA
jgi:hypothetical protein